MNDFWVLALCLTESINLDRIQLPIPNKLTFNNCTCNHKTPKIALEYAIWQIFVSTQMLTYAPCHLRQNLGVNR